MAGPGGEVFTRLRHEDFYPTEQSEGVVHPAECNEDVYPTECNEGVYPEERSEDFYPAECNEDAVAD